MSSPEVRPEPPQYTIDDLATASHVPSRTIRFYQSRGALMPPEIRGRVAYYGKPHIERLELIAQLQDRGLRIDAIRDLLSSIDRGELDLAEWLGVEQQLQASWADDQPKTVTEEELYRLAGSRRAGLLGELLRVGVIERHGDVYLLHSPALLTLALKLESVGIDLETAKEAAAIIRKHMRRTVDDLVDLFMKRAGKGLIESKDASALFQALRPSGMEAVRILFGREMERALRKLLESGKLAALARAPRTKRRR
ncbi:MAG TPA: MerR family transcriptional regulator [Polyangiaceae bacterium]|jgi:DNA-binding transcriptional MerR regulator|nr:MerR family transcriptional regulator [Polyangiaceae bacterium]